MAKNKTRNHLPRPVEVLIDVLLAKDQVMSGREKCSACEGIIEPDECILRIRDMYALVDYFIHRRCLLIKLAAGPVDDAEYDEYVRSVQAKYAAV